MALLDGLKVLDLTDERGLMAGRLLADLGADVVILEPPGGSTARQVPPAAGPESFFWSTYGANRRSVAGDLRTDEGRRLAQDLVRVADFLIESSEVGALAAVGLGWDEVRELNPSLIYVSITAFGQSGPKAGYAASDLTVWAAGGPLAYNRDEVGPPLRISVPQAFLHASADAAGGALIAHLARLKTGRGQHVDVSAQASLGLATLAAVLIGATGDQEPDWLPATGARIDQSGSGSRTRRSKWPVQDGFVELHLTMGPAVGGFANKFFQWMHDEGGCPDEEIVAWDWRRMPEMIRDGTVTDDQMEKARTYVASFLAGKTKRQVTEAALEYKLLSVGIADVADLAHSEQFADRQFLLPMGGDGPAVPGPIARSSDPSAFSFRRAAPSLGAHTAEVVAEWLNPPADRSSSAIRSGSAETPPLRPLEGLKVADLSWVVAGPMIGRALADFGATVVRVESSSRIETARHMAPFYGGQPATEASALYMNCNAGKLGLALDLSTEPGREVARDLATWADVVIESYTPGLIARWGLGYEQLSEHNPGLIMLSSSLMGNTGPQSRLAGFGNIGAAISGFQYIVGWPDRPPLGPFGPYTDFLAPRLALVALLAALAQRDRTGLGCYLDVSQAECGAWFLSPEIAAYQSQGWIQQRRGNRDSAFAPHGVFPCLSGGDGSADHVAIAVTDDEQFAALAELIGRRDLTQDKRFGTASGRLADQDPLEAAISGWTATMSAADIERACQAAGIPAHRAATSRDYLADPQLAARSHLIEMDHPQFGRVVVEGPRYLMSETPGKVDRLAPQIGQHTDLVLSEILRYLPDRIAALKQMGALQ
jgi:crotonobetainyl-CoA:carnitine CoA-transferase CaiB-like acyl-CoA transferase